jgi:hypothetical protein
MRLLQANTDGSFSLTMFAGNQIPRYAILSHKWQADDHEVTFQDLADGTASSKQGYRKIQFCAKQAEQDGIQYFWVDSCCINKMDFTEVSTSINSMFRWYRNSIKCYVYLSDVSVYPSIQWESTFVQSNWFTRGWTLQELLAPRSVEFFSRTGRRLGDKTSLEQQIHRATGIAVHALRGTPLSQFSIGERMIWAARRVTTIEEDYVYCLMALFNIFLPVIYGEGVEHAFIRLLDEIQKRISIEQRREGILALI